MLKKITDLLLKVETLEENKKVLVEKLALKEKKWIENDRLFKERRITLMAVLQQNLALLGDVGMHQEFLQSQTSKRLGQQTKALLMI